jgi:hypothetical protein
MTDRCPSCHVRMTRIVKVYKGYQGRLVEAGETQVCVNKEILMEDPAVDSIAVAIGQSLEGTPEKVIGRCNCNFFIDLAQCPSWHIAP